MPPVPPPASSLHRISTPLVCLVLVLAACAAYSNSFSGPFLYDDVPSIKDNPSIRQLWPLSTVLIPPNDSGITVNGRPLVNLSLAINYAFGGLNVFGYHVVNLLIHVLAGLALFGSVRRALQLPKLKALIGPGDLSTPIAFCSALLWLVHPLQTESVTYVIQRAESLVGLFYLVTFYCFVRYVENPARRLWAALTVLSCLAGMASKEVMASAPLLVLVFDRAAVSGTFRDAWQRHRGLYLGLAATWIPLAFLVAHTGGRGGTAGFGAGGVTSWQYALTSALAIGKYLKLTFWPSQLVFDYGVGIERELLPVLPQSLMIVTLLALGAYALVKLPIVGFIALWFFAILGPSSSIIPIASETMAEHRMYLPLAAITTLVACLAARYLKRVFLIAHVAIGLVFIFLTVERNKDYSHELILWKDAQTKYPINARAHNNVGEIYFRQDKFDEAIACFREAVRLLPNYTDALNNLGNSLTQRGAPTEALPFLNQALIFKPNYAETYNNLGNAYYQLGDREKAIAHYSKSIELKPHFAEAHNNLGVVLGELGQDQQAIPHYEIALKYKDSYADAHYNYGNALSRTGHPAEAEKQYHIALGLRPRYAEALNNLGGIYFNRGDLEKAKQNYKAALEIKPDYPDAHNNMGVALFQANLLTEALPYFTTALKLKPDYRDAKNNSAEIYNILGAEAVTKNDLTKARDYFERAVRLNKDHPSANNNLGVVLWRAGYPDLAVPYMKEAIRIKPDYTDAIDALKEIEAQLQKAKAAKAKS